MTPRGPSTGWLRSGLIIAYALRVVAVSLYLGWLRAARGPEAAKAAEDRAYRYLARRFRELAIRLRGLLIKVGQFLSTRVDFLPESITSELAQLQDAVPAEPFAAIRRQIETELDLPLEGAFRNFAVQPVAAASLGQVHFAELSDGTEVAVKVLRPGIERLVATDLTVLRNVLRFFDRVTRVGRRVDLAAVYREFRATVLEELNYEQEAANLLRFQGNFRGQENVVVPRVYEAWSTRRVMVMDRVEGIKVNLRDELAAAGLDPGRVAEDLIVTYFKQIMVDGFFHADPHPGNIFVQAREAEGVKAPVLVFVDFGMMGRLDEDQRKAMRRLVEGVVLRDMELVVQAVDDLGFLRPHANRRTLKKGLRYAVDQVAGGRVTQPGTPEYDRFLREMRDFLYTEPFQLPADFTFLGRAIGIVVGTATALEPGFDFLGVLQRRAPHYLKGQSGRPEAEAGDPRLDSALQSLRRVVAELGPSAWALLRLPQKVEEVLDARRAEAQVPSSDALRTAALAGASIIAGALLWNGDHRLLAGLVWLWAAWSQRSAVRGSRRQHHRAWD